MQDGRTARGNRTGASGGTVGTRPNRGRHSRNSSELEGWAPSSVFDLGSYSPGLDHQSVELWNGITGYSPRLDDRPFPALWTVHW